MSETPKVDPNLEEEKKRIEEDMRAADGIIDQVVRMSPVELCKKLTQVGVQETYQEGFRNLIEKGRFTPQPIVEHWVKAIKKESGILERVFLEAAAAKLWSIWAIDLPMDRTLHFLYQSGYQLIEDKKPDEAKTHWEKLWKALQNRGYKEMSELPGEFPLEEPPGMKLQLKDWAADYNNLSDK